MMQLACTVYCTGLSGAAAEGRWAVGGRLASILNEESESVRLLGSNGAIGCQAGRTGCRCLA